MRCLRLSHVNVRVVRLDEALRWYQAALGLEEIERRDASGRGAWLRLGDAELHLAEDAAPEPPSKRHFAVVVDDLDAVRRAVTWAGGRVEKEEVGRFWTRDPAGNRIEIVREASP
jgi:catechol 2,3-dioxygenase-like lactoylglutathione lyase family enzyme